MTEQRRAIKTGSYIYARHGGYVGQVEAVGDGILRVRGLLPDNPVYYIPTDAVTGALASGRELFLDCSLDELHSKGWLHPPHGYRRARAH